MTEREGAEGSQLSQALDFVPLRQGAVRGPLHREEIMNFSFFFFFNFLGRELSFSRSNSNRDGNKVLHLVLSFTKRLDIVCLRITFCFQAGWFQDVSGRWKVSFYRL